MLALPPGLTEEEEALQKRFAKLRKKKKALLALKKQQSSAGQSSQGGIKRSMSDQPPVDTATATEQAKLLVKSGAISAIKAENKNSGFKRSRTLEGKLKDPEKGPTPTFQPFQRSISADDDSQESRRPQRKSLYESFVSASERLREPEGGGGRGDPPERGERRLDWEQEPEPEERSRERDGVFRRSDSFPERRPPPEGEHAVRVRGGAEPRAAARSLRPLRSHHRPLHGQPAQLRLRHLREDGVGRPGHRRAERGGGAGRAAQGQHRPQAAAAGRSHREIALGVPGGEEQRQGLAPGQALAGRVQRGPFRGAIKEKRGCAPSLLSRLGAPRGRDPR
uniref:Negative elongation factor complex member E n=1 Tax=Aquila chrysaetos chrysaetos TaxID=223781 RepID=A0A663FAB8_AQUCH